MAQRATRVNPSEETIGNDAYEEILYGVERHGMTVAAPPPAK